MSKVLVSQAATLTGKSSKTIYRWLSQGRLSYELDKTGQKVIDLSELERIADLRSLNESQLRESEPPAEYYVKPQNSTIETLERLLAEKDARIAELTEDKRRLLALIEHKTDATQPTKVPPSAPLGFFSSKLAKLGL